MKKTPVAEFIEAKGGTKVVADKLDLKPAAVRMWRQRNRLPRTKWPEIIEHLNTTLDELQRVERAA
jgi:hypothetical protein